MEESCETALDCSNSTLIKDCYQENIFTDEEDFCDCHNWIGWFGPLCDKPGPTIHYNRVTACILLIWHTFNFLTALKSFFIYLKFNRNNQPILKSNPVFFVTCLMMLSSFAFILNVCLDIPSLYDHTYFEVSVQNSFIFGEIIEVQAKNRNIRLLLLPLGAILHFISCLVIVLSWLSIFEKMNQVFHVSKIYSEARIKQMIYVTTVFTFTFGCLFSVLNLLSELLLIYFIGTLLITIWYTISYLKFKKIFLLFMDNELDEKEKRTLKLVKTTWLINASCFVVVIITTVLLIVSLNIHSVIVEIGGFNYLVIFLNLQSLAGLTSISYTSYYVFRINKNLLQQYYPDKILSWVSQPL